METLEKFLGAEPAGEGAWTFDVPRELHGAFGGAFGGIIAACSLIAARSAAPGRVPNALDCRFVRGLPAGTATARVNVLHSGRSLSTIAVDLLSSEEKLCTRSTISLVQPSLLVAIERPSREPGDWKPHAEASQWPAIAPIISTIDCRLVGNDEQGMATAMKIPWQATPECSAESASMAADMAVGPPLGQLASEGASTPNPDLSLRFCGEVTQDELVGVGRLARADGGIAAIEVEVWSAGTLVAVGVSTALMIPRGS